MIGVLHGYLLEGSGSNLLTRSLIGALCRAGRDVHLMCQEPHPEVYDFIAEARLYREDGSVETLLERDTGLPGRCVMHKPFLGDTLPVYVRDMYEEFTNVVPMVELGDAAIEDYLARNVAVLERVVREHGLSALSANHTVLMPEVARRVAEKTGIPYAVMPHGSAIEFAVKKDPRFFAFGERGLREAKKVFCCGGELAGRLPGVFPALDDLPGKTQTLPLGVDTSRFEPVDPARRPGNVREVLAAVKDLARGRSAAQGAGLLASLSESSTFEDVVSACAAASTYDGKRPDADLEAKFAAQDWSRGENLLFVGRLIQTKGAHSVLAALPEILEARPGTRVIVVGHGGLREPLEVFVQALAHGWRGVAEAIVARSAELPGSEGEPWEAVTRYWAGLRARGKLERYFNVARKVVRPADVVFTGYLTHRELRWLFPVCDAGLFPSVVPESGPLVFLEAMASGVFPLGTYFAGMKASIDAVAERFPAADVELMKLSRDPRRTCADIARQVPAALALEGRHRAALNAVARERYDWTRVAELFSSALESLRALS